MSFRDVLRDRGVLPEEDGLEAVSVGQKIVTTEGIGMVSCVGSRFITVAWAGSRKERIARSRLKIMLQEKEATLLPTFLRTARYGNDLHKV